MIVPRNWVLIPLLCLPPGTLKAAVKIIVIMTAATTVQDEAEEWGHWSRYFEGRVWIDEKDVNNIVEPDEGLSSSQWEDIILALT